MSVIDWTKPNKIKEIAWFDRGPIDATRLVLGRFCRRTSRTATSSVAQTQFIQAR